MMAMRPIYIMATYVHRFPSAVQPEEGSLWLPLPSAPACSRHEHRTAPLIPHQIAVMLRITCLLSLRLRLRFLSPNLALGRLTLGVFLCPGGPRI